MAFYYSGINNPGEVRISDAKISAGKAVFSSSNNAVVKVQISSGEMKAQKLVKDEGRFAPTIAGGTFKGGVDKAELDPYVIDGYEAVELPDEKGTYVIDKVKPSVAEVTGKQYQTLEAAFAAARDGETVKVLEDTGIDTAIAIAGKAVTLDLNGKTVESPKSGVLMAFTIGEDGKLAVDDASDGHKGTITAPWSNRNAQVIKVEGEFVLNNGVLDTRAMKAVNVENNGKVTVKGGTIRSDAPATIDVYGQGSVTIEGGVVETVSTVGNAIRLKEKYALKITGEKVKAEAGKTVFHADTVTDSYDNQILAGTFTSDAFVVKEEGKGTHFQAVLTGGTYVGMEQPEVDLYAQKPGYVAYLKDEATKNCVVEPARHYVAQIGETKYETLREAFRNAEDGDTITLLADVENADAISVEKALTLDLTGHTVTMAVKRVDALAVEPGGALTIQDTSEGGQGGITDRPDITGNENLVAVRGTLTLKSGTLEKRGPKTSTLSIQGSGKAVIEGGTVQSAVDIASQNYVVAVSAAPND